VRNGASLGEEGQGQSRLESLGREKGAVTMYVIQDLASELYIELLAGFHK
jgi:hypothetical protein